MVSIDPSKILDYLYVSGIICYDSTVNLTAIDYFHMDPKMVIFSLGNLERFGLFYKMWHDSRVSM